MKLYLVRHGIAVARTDPKCPPEARRPLTPEGIQKTRAAALGLKALKIRPDLLITSPFVRAAETAEIFAEALGISRQKIRTSDALKPMADPAEFAKEIAQIRGREVMCFGHAPHLDLMIAHLVGAPMALTELKKAGVACLERVAPRGKWWLRWVLKPRILRQLAE